MSKKKKRPELEPVAGAPLVGDVSNGSEGESSKQPVLTRPTSASSSAAEGRRRWARGAMPSALWHAGEGRGGDPVVSARRLVPRGR